MASEPLEIRQPADPSLILLALRFRLHLSQAELSGLTSFDKTVIAKAERGKEMRLSVLNRLVESLGGRLDLVLRLPLPRCEYIDWFGEQRLETSRSRRRGYRASFATEWTQSLRKSQRWQKLVSGLKTAASIPDAAACTSAAKVSAPEGS